MTTVYVTGVQAQGTVGKVAVWITINDNQPNNWQNVNDVQASNWRTVLAS